MDKLKKRRKHTLVKNYPTVKQIFHQIQKITECKQVPVRLQFPKTKGFSLQHSQCSNAMARQHGHALRQKEKRGFVKSSFKKKNGQTKRKEENTVRRKTNEETFHKTAKCSWGNHVQGKLSKKKKCSFEKLCLT